MKRYKTPREYVLFLLGRREYSVKELTNKALKYFPDHEKSVLDLIKKFEQEKKVSDERFCDVFIRSEVIKGNGVRKIYQKLLLKGIAKDLAKHKCNECIKKEDVLEQVQHLARKKQLQILRKYPHISEFELRGKITQYLAGRGFDYGLIKSGLDFLKSEA